MQKLPNCPLPDDLSDWQDEITYVKPLPPVDELPQAPLIIDEITPSPDVKGLYNHNSFTPLEIGATANIDRNLAEKFTSGKLKIEARLDLHGSTEKQAFTLVRDFIANSYALRRRCVLIITGKGQESEQWWENKGVIRRSFPQWLNHIEIRPYLLSVAPAAPHDGGQGAFYCLLKRYRP